MTNTTKLVHVALHTGVLAAMLLLSSSFALAHSGHGHENASTTPSTSVDVSCVQTAIETRETAILSGWGDFNTAIVTALGERKTALKAAWGLTDKTAQKSGVATAWKEWKADKKTAHVELKKDRKAAWDAFKKTVKDTCKVTTTKDEALEKDSSGSIAL